MGGGIINNPGNFILLTMNAVDRIDDVQNFPTEAASTSHCYKNRRQDLSLQRFAREVSETFTIRKHP